jgi:DNA adenine methylase
MAQMESVDIKEKLESHLKHIQSSNGNYKRVYTSPIRYAGGKTKAIGLILEHFPTKLKTNIIVSPFMGGGSLEITLAKVLDMDIVCYDIFDFLVNYWKHQLNSPQELYNELKKLNPSKDDYTLNRHILLNYWEKVKPQDLNYETRNRLLLSEEQKNLLDDNPLKQAAYYYYNMQLSYGPMFLGWPSSVYLVDKKYEKVLERVRDFKAPNLKVEQASFEEVIQKHPNDFLFCDPPYYLGEDSKMFKGMYPNCNFAIHHENFNHELFRDLLKKHKGGFFITYNDCPTIREWYKDFKQIYPKWQYTYGQGEKRIGENRKTNKTNIKESHEIFIICEPNF